MTQPSRFSTLYCAKCGRSEVVSLDSGTADEPPSDAPEGFINVGRTSEGTPCFVCRGCNVSAIELA